MSTGDKILIVGLSKAGKTAIANFLAKYPDAERAASPPSSYTPTVGTRYAMRAPHRYVYHRCCERLLPVSLLLLVVVLVECADVAAALL